MSKRKKEEPRTGPIEPCSVQGCREPGDFKAPAMRDSEGKYQYLCLEHVRKFNEAWNYFDGWSQREIEAFMHSSVHGHRPTWATHQHGSRKAAFTPESLEEALMRMMTGASPIKRPKPETKAQRARREALAVLNLVPESEMAEVKSQYKKLVKKYHPDVNSTKEAEDMFKRITAAYVLLTKQEQYQEKT